jgi:hypothetical protein
MFFSPNTTSIYQPLDQGIIAVIKTRYKTRQLTKMVNAAENFDELQVGAEKLPNGRKGISYGLLAHVLDAHSVRMNCQLRLYLPAGDDQDVSRFWTQNLSSRSKVLPKPTAEFSQKQSTK